MRYQAQASKLYFWLFVVPMCIVGLRILFGI